MQTPIRSFQIGAVNVELLIESSDPLLHPGELYPDSSPELIARQSWLTPIYTMPPPIAW